MREETAMDVIRTWAKDAEGAAACHRNAGRPTRAEQERHRQEAFQTALQLLDEGDPVTAEYHLRGLAAKHRERGELSVARCYEDSARVIVTLDLTDRARRGA